MLIVQMSLDENYTTSMQSPDQDLGQNLCQVRNREVVYPLNLRQYPQYEYGRSHSCTSSFL